MDFKNWIKDDAEFFEFADLADAETNDIELEFEGDTCDEDQLRDSCLEDSYSSFDEDPIYEEPEDDPNFRGVTVEEWENDNPAPDPDDYEEGDADPDYAQDMTKWKEARKIAEAEYAEAVSDWEDQMKERAEENESNRDEWVNDCVSDQMRDCEQNAEHKYARRFVVGDKTYEVEMEREEESFFNKSIYAWAITFVAKGSGYATTKLNQGQHVIYSQLLLTLKKLFEMEEVEALKFTPAEPAMAIVYHRFYKTFLAKDFVPVSEDLLVKRELVDAYLRNRSRDREGDRLQLAKVQQEIEQNLRSIRQQKIGDRSHATAVQFFRGQKDDGSYVDGYGIIVGSTETGYLVAPEDRTKAGTNHDPMMDVVTVPRTNIRQLGPAEMAQIQNLVARLRRSRPDLVDLHLKKMNTAPLAPSPQRTLF